MPESNGKIRRKHPAVLPWVVILSFFVGELFFYTWCRVQSMKVSYEISKAMALRKELAKLEKDLTIELAHLRSPRRLTRMARKRFGLQMPMPEQVVMLP